jgi:hypothetical protein
VRNFGPSLLDAAFASVDRKLDLFGTDGNYFRIPTTSPHRELIGRNVDELSVTDATDNIEFALDVHGDFANVRPESRFVPAHLAGRARWRDKNDPAVIAVAVNGTVRATTRTYTFRGRGAPGSWSVVLPPDSFHTGENDIDLFVVRPADTPVLHRAHFSHAPPVNLLSDTAAYGLRVTHEGLHDREGDGQGSFRWTNGNARIVVPLEGRPAPRSVRLNLATAGPQEKDLTVRVNGCAIFEGKVPTGRWSRIFAIQDCGEDDETVIELLSNTHQPSSKRELGVAVERLDLLDQPWPPAATPLPESDRRSHIRLRNLSGDGATVKSTQTIAVTVANRGTALWPSRGDVNREHAIVRFGVLWFRRGDTRQPAAVQRVELPRTLVPGDSVDLSFQLVPVGHGNEPLPAGEYEAWLGVLQEGVSWFYSSGDSVRKLRVAHSP